MYLPSASIIGRLLEHKEEHIVIEGYEKAVFIDTRSYPARNVQEPEKYKVLRGSRDGFVETLLMNTALIRRRIRNPEYMCEVVRIGKSSRTDIAI